MLKDVGRFRTPRDETVTVTKQKRLLRCTFTVKIMILSRYRLVLDFGWRYTQSIIVTLPSLTVGGTVRDCGDIEGRECHDNGRSVTMGHDDLKMVTGQNHNFYIILKPIISWTKI